MLEKRSHQGGPPVSSARDVLTLCRPHAQALVNRHVATGLPARDLELAAWRSLLAARRAASGSSEAFLDDAVAFMDATVAQLRRGRGRAAVAGADGSFVSLVDADRDLFAQLGENERRAARPFALAESLSLRRGEWDGRPARGRSSDHALALLIVDGFLLCRVECGGSATAEVLGPRNVVLTNRRDSTGDGPGGRATVAWRILTASEIAVIDGELLGTLCRWPPVVAALVQRVARRSHDIALQLAATNARGIETRLMRLFELLAERFGRRHDLGLQVPVPLTHGMLAELVGAARPPVSTAVRRLECDQQLLRADDRTWVVRRLGSAPRSGRRKGRRADGRRPRLAARR